MVISGNLTQDDVDTISDLMLDFVETWGPIDFHIGRPTKWFVEVSLKQEIYRHGMFQSEKEKEEIFLKKEHYREFEKELYKVIERIKKFGYQVNGGEYESNGYNHYYFSFCKS